MANIQCYESNFFVTIDVDAETMTFPVRHSNNLPTQHFEAMVQTSYVLSESLYRFQKSSMYPTH